MRLTLKARLAATFAVVLALLGALAVVAERNMRAIDDRLDLIVEDHADNILIAAHMRLHALEMQIDMNELLLSEDPEQLAAAGAAIDTHRAGLQAALTQMLEGAGPELQAQLQDIRAVLADLDGVLAQVTTLAQAQTNTRGRHLMREARAAAVDAPRGPAPGGRPQQRSGGSGGRCGAR